MNVYHQRGNNLRGKDPKSQWINAHFEKDAENKQIIYLDKKALLSMELCTSEVLQVSPVLCFQTAPGHITFMLL